MNTTAQGKLPLWFRIAAYVALAWSLMGVTSYLADVTMGAEAYGKMPEAQRTLYETRPAWVTGAFAIAVFTALAGAIALVLRKTLATPFFIASLIAVIIQFGYGFLGMNALRVVGAAGAIFPTFIIIAAIAMLWLSTQAEAKGWLR
ncbi:MAG: hypothetical protein RIE56_12515 [Amphiplicatus sp.]